MLKRRLIQRLHELHSFPISYPDDISIESLQGLINEIENAMEVKRIKANIKKIKRKLVKLGRAES